jgi:hypothetical protein
MIAIIFREEFQDGDNQVKVEIPDHLRYIRYYDDIVDSWWHPSITEQGKIAWHPLDRLKLSESARSRIDQIFRRIWEMRLFL